jgi:hypothetical protein
MTCGGMGSRTPLALAFLTHKFLWASVGSIGLYEMFRHRRWVLAWSGVPLLLLYFLGVNEGGWDWPFDPWSIKAAPEFVVRSCYPVVTRDGAFYLPAAR